MTTTGNFECFHYFISETNFLKKWKLSKIGALLFSSKCYYWKWNIPNKTALPARSQIITNRMGSTKNAPPPIAEIIFEDAFPLWLSLIKNIVWDGFYWGLQIFFEYCLYTLLVETIPTRFYWLICTKLKLFQSKTLQKKLFVLIPRLDKFLSAT